MAVDDFIYSSRCMPSPEPQTCLPLFPAFLYITCFFSTFGSFGPFSTPDTSRPSTASKTAPSSMGRCLKRPGGASVGPAVAFSGVSWMENLIEAQSLPDWEADGRDQDLEHKDVVFLRHAKNDLRSFWIIKTMQNLPILYFFGNPWRGSTSGHRFGGFDAGMGSLFAGLRPA